MFVKKETQKRVLSPGFWLSRRLSVCNIDDGLIFVCSEFYLNLFIYFSFSMYPAHSRVGRGYLMLRRSVPQYPPDYM